MARQLRCFRAPGSSTLPPTKGHALKIPSKDQFLAITIDALLKARWLKVAGLILLMVRPDDLRFIRRRAALLVIRRQMGHLSLRQFVELVTPLAMQMGLLLSPGRDAQFCALLAFMNTDGANSRRAKRERRAGVENHIAIAQRKQLFLRNHVALDRARSRDALFDKTAGSQIANRKTLKRRRVHFKFFFQIRQRQRKVATGLSFFRKSYSDSSIRPTPVAV